MRKTISKELATGLLHIDLEAGRIPLQRLLGFAARVSSKRKFLLVSKVLGKHYPVTPRLMAWSYRALARAVLQRGAGDSSVFIGMAETATGLGYGVFEAACREGLLNGLFMQTTRYTLADIERLEFEEAHSHATDFFLYYPDNPQYRQQFLNAQTLVLIDDEISTGKTFLRLIKAYQRVNPELKKVLIVSLVNFAHADDRHALESEAGVEVEWICFRQGQLRFEERLNIELDAITVNVSGNCACKKHLLAWPGRLGMNAPVVFEPEVVSQLIGLMPEQDQRPVLVLGTGECNAPAFLLGRELERRGLKIKVQSTTRSPIHIGNDIAGVCEFEDNYEDGIVNFIYNMQPESYRAIILCHETPLCAPLTERLNAWNAISARFELNPDSNHAKLHFLRS